MTVTWALTWLGQSAALAALVLVLVRLPGCRQRAATRYAAWFAVLLACAALLTWPQHSASAPAGGRIAAAGSGVPAAPLAPIILPAPVEHLSSWLAWMWALGAAALLALVARDVGRIFRLKRLSAPLSARELRRLRACAAVVGPGGGPRVCWCDELESPAVLGFGDPIIALPRLQTSCLTDEQLQHVVLHELAHVRRCDSWSLLVERVVAALLWVNPAIHVARRQLALAREMACDEWVVRQAASPAAYARSLAEVAGLRSRARRLRMATAMAGGPGTLRRRIVGVLALDRRPPARAAALAAWLAPVAVCVTAAGLLQLPPMFVVAHDTQIGLQVRTLAMAFAPIASMPAGSAVEASEAPGSSPPARGAVAGRRRVQVITMWAPAFAASVSRPQAPAGRDVIVEQIAAGGEEPLLSSPLPLAGAAGVAAAETVRQSFQPEAAAAEGRWDGPAAIGDASGRAAAAAGRATASFFKRVGASVPKLFTE